MPRTPVRVSKNAETIKAYEGIIEEYRKALEAYKQNVKTLEKESAYLKATLAGTEEKIFPPASGQKTIAEEKRDKDLGAVRSVLTRKIREEITQKTLEGHMNVLIYMNELVHIEDELLETYNYGVIMEPIVKSLRAEDYWVDEATRSIGGCFRYGYFVSWN